MLCDLDCKLRCTVHSWRKCKHNLKALFANALLLISWHNIVLFPFLCMPYSTWWMFAHIQPVYMGWNSSRAPWQYNCIYASSNTAKPTTCISLPHRPFMPWHLPSESRPARGDRFPCRVYSHVFGNNLYFPRSSFHASILTSQQVEQPYMLPAAYAIRVWRSSNNRSLINWQIGLMDAQGKAF